MSTCVIGKNETGTRCRSHTSQVLKCSSKLKAKEHLEVRKNCVLRANKWREGGAKDRLRMTSVHSTVRTEILKALSAGATERDAIVKHVLQRGLVTNKGSITDALVREGKHRNVGSALWSPAASAPATYALTGQYRGAAATGGRRASPRLQAQPRGPAPEGSQWDCFSGQYVSSRVVGSGHKRRRQPQQGAPAAAAQRRVRPGAACGSVGGDDDEAGGGSGGGEADGAASLPTKGSARAASASEGAAKEPAAEEVAQWVGEPISLGERGERFYQAVSVEGEHFHVGDDVVVSGHCEREVMVARVVSLWESGEGEKEAELKWYYSPEQTASGRLAGHDPRELFEAVHTDDNPLAAIDGKACVLEWEAYQRWLDAPVAEGNESLCDR